MFNLFVMNPYESLFEINPHTLRPIVWPCLTQGVKFVRGVVQHRPIFFGKLAKNPSYQLIVIHLNLYFCAAEHIVQDEG